MRDEVPIELDPPGQRVSYAQNGEDVRLWRALDDIEAGFYVEVGGWDPEVESVSRSFYGRGWSGIIMEPVLEKAAAYAARRPRDTVLQKLAGATSGTAPFHEFPDTGLSTTVAEHAERHAAAGYRQTTHELPVTTLDEVLADAPDTIHFLLIDTEGAEAEVLKGLDLSAHRPWILVIESTLPNSTVESYQDWEGDVLAAGYAFACFDGLNRYYVAAEHGDLAARLVPPPSVHDKYMTFPQYLDRMAAMKAVAERDAALAHWDAAVAQSEVTQMRLELVNAQLQNARLRKAEAEERAAHVELDAERRVDEALRAHSAAAALNHELGEELKAIVSSKSWRVTAPLRRTLGRG